MKILKTFLLITVHCAVLLFSFYAYFAFVQPKIFHDSKIQTVLSAENTPTGTSHALIPIVSNQWFSNIYKSFPTQPLYALPLAIKFTNSGIGFSYPKVQASAHEIDAPYTQDFLLNTASDITQIKPLVIGDWSVVVRLTDSANHTNDVLIGHGLPFATVDTSTDLIIKPAHTFSISDGKHPITQPQFQSGDFLLTTNNSSYIIAPRDPITVEKKGKEIILHNPRHLFIGLLDSSQNYDNFKQIKTFRLVDSTAYPSLDTDTFATQYKITTNGLTPLIALYPHQSENLVENLPALGEYQTIRGPLKLVKTSSFTTGSKMEVPPQTYPKLTQEHTDLNDALKQDIEKTIQEGPPASKDYFLGTWFGKVSELLLLADTFEEKDERNKLLSYIEPIFYQSLQNFTYDKNQTSYLAKYPEFGNENLSDHHFQYSYYIRLASVLASLDLPSLQRTQPVIDQMVADIATTKRDDNTYPFLRNFDLYESHSWADGYADNQFGNNQESSSEAINAWYALYLWSQVSNNQTLKQYALYLYNAEIMGAKYYWFNNSSIYPKPYTHAIASRVWGGRVDFSTWFSEKTNMKYGIQFLPFTPASEYLGQLTNFQNYEKDFANSKGDIQDEWGDQYVMFQSFYQPDIALHNKNKVSKFEQRTPKSKFLYFIYKNKENQQASPSPS